MPGIWKDQGDQPCKIVKRGNGIEVAQRVHSMSCEVWILGTVYESLPASPDPSVGCKDSGK